MLQDMTWLLAKLAPATVGDTLALITMLLVAAAYFLADYTWNRPSSYRHMYYERPQEKDAATRLATRATRNIAQRLEELVRKPALSLLS